MAKTFYVRLDGSQVIGPIEPAKLKAAFAAGGFDADAEISKSPTGPWTPARNVPGITFAGKSPAAEPATDAAKDAAVDPPETVDEDDVLPDWMTSVPETREIPVSPESGSFATPVMPPAPIDEDEEENGPDDDGPDRFAFDPAAPSPRKPPRDSSKKPRPARVSSRTTIGSFFTFGRFYLPTLAKWLMWGTYLAQTIAFGRAVYELYFMTLWIRSELVTFTVVVAFLLLGWIIALLTTRVFFEFLVVVFRIYEVLDERLEPASPEQPTM